MGQEWKSRNYPDQTQGSQVSGSQVETRLPLRDQAVGGTQDNSGFRRKWKRGLRVLRGRPAEGPWSRTQLSGAEAWKGLRSPRTKATSSEGCPACAGAPRPEPSHPGRPLTLESLSQAGWASHTLHPPGCELPHCCGLSG
jgi:hypothetical protein